MFLFKKKKIYKVVWNYSLGLYPHTEIVKAYDEAHAWKKIRNQHFYNITLVSMEEVK